MEGREGGKDKREGEREAREGEKREKRGGRREREMDRSLNFLLQEKVDAMEVLGADVKLVPAVPFTDPKNYNHQVIEQKVSSPNLWTLPQRGSDVRTLSYL